MMTSPTARATKCLPKVKRSKGPPFRLTSSRSHRSSRTAHPMVKKVKAEAENCKVSIRSIRRESNEALKALLKDGVPEDEIKNAEAKAQTLTDGFIVVSDKHAEKKEQDILTV